MTTHAPHRRPPAQRASPLPIGGGPVILYARTARPGRPDVLLGRLRRYAARQRCEVTAEIIDHAPPAIPMAHRRQWPRIDRLITHGSARGIVTPAWTDVRYVDRFLTLDAWLDDRRAFLAVTEPER
ncbi:hypothetical protein [Streptomyces sp. NPDC018031]|uniref:hypothetical protein n=1 Tax=Streptomyces sp. NPDC018031 TaxID=3365033 RepID=UPI00379A44E2